MNQIKAMDSTQLCSFLLTVITGTVFPGHILGVIPVTEKSFKQAVLTPFVDGLNILKSVAESLLKSTNLPQVIQNVFELLESSHKSLSKAEESSVALLKSLSANVEKNLDKINRLSEEQKVLQVKKQVLKVHLYGYQGQDSIDNQLQAAKKDLKNATDGVSRATKAWHDANEKRKKGIGMLFIPVVGPILGTMTMMKAKTAVQKAVKDLKEARSMRTIHKKAVKMYESQYLTNVSAIRSTEQTIAANTVNMQVLQHDLNSERALHKNLDKFLISLRKCTSLLSTVAGKTSAANMYLELSGVIDGLLGVLNEIVVTLHPLVKSSKEYSLLISASLPTIIHKLEEANRRLKKAAAP